MDTISTGGVNHVALTVTDRDRSRDFYMKVLGFRFVMEFGLKYLLSEGSVILALTPPPDPGRAIGYAAAGWATEAFGAPAVFVAGGLVTALVAGVGLTIPLIRNLD